MNAQSSSLKQREPGLWAVWPLAVGVIAAVVLYWLLPPLIPGQWIVAAAAFFVGIGVTMKRSAST